MNALKYYIDYNVEHHSENKNVLLIENPIEMFSSYLKQIQVDDEDIEDYKDILMALKRSDTDLVSI
jgi:type II secretory ATPase GspE/PulE/Tfp pilus assembly ATPase PilB-like protein